METILCVNIEKLPIQNEAWVFWGNNFNKVFNNKFDAVNPISRCDFENSNWMCVCVCMFVSWPSWRNAIESWRWKPDRIIKFEWEDFFRTIFYNETKTYTNLILVTNETFGAIFRGMRSFHGLVLRFDKRWSALSSESYNHKSKHSLTGSTDCTLYSISFFSSFLAIFSFIFAPFMIWRSHILVKPEKTIRTIL